MDPKGIADKIFQTGSPALRDDMVWKQLGFRRRPRGGLITSFFKSRWKTEMEDRVAFVIWATHIASLVKLVPEQDRILKLVIEQASYRQFTLMFGLSDVMEFFYKAQDLCAKLIKYDFEDWDIILLEQFRLKNVPSTHLHKTITMIPFYTNICKGFSLNGTALFQDQVKIRPSKNQQMSYGEYCKTHAAELEGLSPGDKTRAFAAFREKR